MPHDLRDQVVDFMNRWAEKTEIAIGRLVSWAGLARSKFFDWKERYGKVNEHNVWIPRDHWLEDWEKKAIIAFHQQNPLEGYRRLTFMMLDADVVAVSPSSVYRVLAQAGLLDNRKCLPSKKGTGFVQPLAPHEHWHVDVSYLNICGTFYYLCSVLDGCSRLIVHWEIREQMKESDVETILERAKEKYPQARPRVITDNGPQFIARDFKEFIRISGMTHVRLRQHLAPCRSDPGPKYKSAASLTTTLAGAIWFCPVKQRRALLKSNPPRDNWMRRRNKNVSTFWGGQNLPEKFCWKPLFQSLLMPQKTWARGQESPSRYCLNVNWKSPFHAEPRHLLVARPYSSQPKRVVWFFPSVIERRSPAALLV